jgi:hypothetical protein
MKNHPAFTSIILMIKMKTNNLSIAVALASLAFTFNPKLSVTKIQIVTIISPVSYLAVLQEVNIVLR